MANIIDWNEVVLTPELVRNINQGLFVDGILAQRMEAFHTIQTGVKSNKQILYFGEMEGLVGKKSTANCTPNAHSNQVPVMEKIWELGPWDARFNECADNLIGKAAIYATNNKIKFHDLTDTDWANIIVDRLMRNIQMAYWRTSWFGDKTAANYNASPSGIINNDVSTSFVNMLNGFFKQMIEHVSKGGDASKQKVSITSNGKSTEAAQFSDLTAQKAYEIIAAMKYNVPMYARNIENGVVMCTQSIYDKLEQYYKGQNIESMFINMQEGIKALKVDGMPVVAIPEWDLIIKSIHDDGTKLYKPHRAVYTNKENLVIGTSDTLEEKNTIDIFFDKKDKNVYIDFVEETDAKVIFDNKFVLAI